MSIKLEKLILNTNGIPFMSCCVRRDEREFAEGKKVVMTNTVDHIETPLPMAISGKFAIG